MLFTGHNSYSVTSKHAILKIINTIGNKVEVEIVDFLPQHRLYHERKKWISNTFGVYKSDLTPYIQTVFTKIPK